MVDDGLGDGRVCRICQLYCFGGSLPFGSTMAVASVLISDLTKP